MAASPLATTESDTHLILTLGTPDGFQIAFAVSPRDIVRITTTVHDHMERSIPSRRILS